MINIKEDIKTHIVQDLLNQRYQSEHLMRQRSTDFTKWILGIGVGLLWIILSKDTITLCQTIVLSSFIIIFTSLATYFLYEICRGFMNNRMIIIKLESTLGFYETNAYSKDSTILPIVYKESSNQKIPSHFKTLFALLIVIGILLLITILMVPNQL